MRLFITSLYAFSIFTNTIAQTPFKSVELQQALSHAQLVLLGEPDHYSTAEMLKKAELVRYLHDSLNYNWLAFESSLYDMHKANQDYLNRAKIRNALYAGIFPIWHRNEAIDSLEGFLTSIKDRKSFQLMGFDSQINSGIYTKKRFIQELQSFLSEVNINLPTTFFESVQKEINAFDAEQYTISENFTPTLLDDLKSVITKLDACNSPKAGFWKQNLISIHGLFYDYYHNQIGERVQAKTFNSKDTNVRDSLMAENMLWFMENHPNEKIIGWGATFHFANNLLGISHLEDNSLQSTKTMGYYLKKALGDKVIIVGFSDLKKIKEANGIFLENKNLYQNQIEVISFDLVPDTNMQSSLIGLGQEGVYPSGKWNKVLDFGIAFNSEAAFKYEGIVVDESNGKPIPFAHIMVIGSNTGTITNENGKFRLFLPAEYQDSKVQISVIGYRPLDVPHQQLNGKLHLKHDVQFLQTVEVIAERKKPVDLLKKVAETFVRNSNKEDYQLDAYYYSWWTDVNQAADTTVNEAALRMIYKNGYSESQQLKHTILNKRLVHGKKHLVPWPIHTIGMADFRPGLGLLNPKISKYLTVDSIQYKISKTDTLFTYFYSMTKSSPKLVGTGADTYSGIITFSSKSLEVKRKSINLGFGGNGLKKATYHINYEVINGFNLPSFAWMEYEGILEGQACVGKEAIRITQILNKVSTDIDKPIIDLEDAPYTPDFWETYNRVIR